MATIPIHIAELSVKDILRDRLRDIIKADSNVVQFDLVDISCPIRTEGTADENDLITWSETTSRINLCSYPFRIGVHIDRADRIPDDCFMQLVEAIVTHYRGLIGTLVDPQYGYNDTPEVTVNLDRQSSGGYTWLCKIRMFGVPLPYRIDDTDVSSSSSSTTQQLDDADRVPTEPTQIL